MKDRYNRSKREVLSESAVARALRENGLPVPKHLGEMMSVEDHAEWKAKQAEASRAAPREIEVSPGVWALPDRRASMLDCGWPLRAVEHAESPHDTEALAAVRGWQQHHNGIVLAGGKGCGKTVAAAWFALTSPLRATMRFIRAATLLRTSNFESGFGDIMSWPAVCLDDLGAEYVDAKGFFMANLDELVDTYYSARRPFIITTNLDGKTFAERYGTRVLDRIKECATWASIRSESLRTNEEPPPWEKR